FDTMGDGPDDHTRIWMVCLVLRTNHTSDIAVIHIDTIYRAAHLIPIYDHHTAPLDVKFYLVFPR
ncbi:hypothetical protein F5I97DRAFT_1807934, partial [Phlebopus sp. FC_14]